MRTKDGDFGCDRQAKSDFTASTTSYVEENNLPGYLVFFEEDSTHNLIPYGENASITSHYDLWADFVTSAGTQKYVFELKDRDCLSTTYDTAYINEEKLDKLDEYTSNSVMFIWVELYKDGVIRCWNLSKVDVSKLERETKYFSKKSVIEGSPIIKQERLKIPMEWGKTISRVTDNGDDK